MSPSAEETALAEVPVARRVARDDEIGSNFRPSGGILWDPWFARRGDEHHVFYLQVPLLDDPEDRHHAGVTIGHASSPDLHTWREHPTALRPGATPDAWDSLALWTGWVLEHEGRAFQFYTGRREREFWFQRIGLAVADDGLETWEKVPGVLLEPDPRHYSTTHELNALGVAPAWRDPCVVKVGDGFHMTISARTADGRPHNACVAHATSADLHTWEIHEPLLSPGRYDEMEATQLVRHADRWYLFFSTWAVHYLPDWAALHGAHSGLHCYVADDLGGEWRAANGTGVVLPDADRRYTVRLVEPDGDDAYTAIGWLNYDDQGRFVGTLSDPVRLVLDGDAVRVAG